ncbi:MAG TPA: biosynthetic-type acetolactate synthase large subunit [Candidatus Avoscillospira stercorigallinarum]|uniref:Acetolactate synthase n=1 Tax=Candidatus Avoscillospira stercorigallinarum TaxID=2840708 RepID=A0A9D1CMZ4_9FIRM|nr:biosynthetic-type acetolactate synthase large subunit [Candidatus Avoscillospira stercorigallinarum]
MQMTGAKILMECLLEQGVDTVFGYPGGTILNVYDELYNYGGKIRHILTAHEQGASHAADGYARSTGKVGVCFATSGPGCTNLTTGIATAYMDSSPVVFVTCNVSENLIGKDSFQEVDITGITMPITKCNYMVRDVNKLADIVREAFAIARGGRPGPVLIDIVKNVTAETAEFTPLPREEHASEGRLGALIKRASHDLKLPEPDMGDVEKLAAMIRESKKPLLICGGGVVRGRAHEEFLKLAEKIDSPVAITVMGAGGFRGRNPLTTGMIGMHGSQASNMAVDACDLLIAVGCRFSDRVALDPKTFAAQAKIVQIDIDRAEINKNVQTDHHIIGDAKRVLELLDGMLTQQDHSEWKKYVFSFKTETEYDEGGSTLTPKQISDVIARICPQDTIVATDVGQHQMWVAQHFHYDYPGQLLTSGGFGTMGFGLGAAIGAKVGNPEKTVIHVTGDGSFRMNCNELATEQYYNLPIITFIYNNQTLGMVRQWQTLIYNGHYSQTTLDRGPDFVKLAEAYGLGGKRVCTVPELEDAVREALASGRGYVIDCAIEMDEMVRPMVPGGGRITQFLVD